jgi:tRNA(Ile)-lysidine synthase
MLAAFARILHEQCLLAPGDRVLVAVSGGADSVALLHLLHALAPVFPFSLLAAHLDHGMRPESPRDAEFVRELCARLSVVLVEGRVDVPAQAASQRRGLEETAREARRRFLRQAADQQACQVVALGHHRDDQAETVLFRLLRGSALTGLAAMRPRSVPFIRPLLSFSRQQIRDFLARQQLPFIEDASNADVTFTRNRIRHQLLPLLRDFNPRIDEHFARFSARLALEEDYWEAEEWRLLAELGRVGEAEVRFERAGLLALHPAVRLRLLRRALLSVRGDLLGVSACHLEGIEKLLLAERPQAELHLPGAWAGRRYEQLWLRRAAPERPFPVLSTIAGPGVYPLPGGGELLVSLGPATLGEDRRSVEFDAGRVPFPLTLRSPHAGDRLRPVGMAGSKKLKDLLIDSKVPREQRQRLLLVVAAEEILWVVGMRRCAGREPAPAGGAVLRLVVKLPESPTIHL